MPGLRLIASSNCATKFKPMNAPGRQCKQIYISQYMLPIHIVYMQTMSGQVEWVIMGLYSRQSRPQCG